MGTQAKSKGNFGRRAGQRNQGRPMGTHQLDKPAFRLSLYNTAAGIVRADKLIRRWTRQRI